LLVNRGLAVGPEHPEPGAVGIAFTLLYEIVRRIEQSERRRDHAFVGVKTEQPAHGPMVA
jgi:hypothetical protein